jgi:hypothetical protein
MTKIDLIQRMSDIGWIVTSQEKLIFTRNFGGRKRGRSITIMFSHSGNTNHVTMFHPFYNFYSTISHFKSAYEDRRLSLNKNFLIKIIKEFKREGIWDVVINKDFLAVNDFNKKSSKAKIRTELKELLS